VIASNTSSIMAVLLNGPDAISSVAAIEAEDDLVRAFAASRIFQQA